MSIGTRDEMETIIVVNVTTGKARNQVTTTNKCDNRT